MLRPLTYAALWDGIMLERRDGMIDRGEDTRVEKLGSLRHQSGGDGLKEERDGAECAVGETDDFTADG